MNLCRHHADIAFLTNVVIVNTNVFVLLFYLHVITVVLTYVKNSISKGISRMLCCVGIVFQGHSDGVCHHHTIELRVVLQLA